MDKWAVRTMNQAEIIPVQNYNPDSLKMKKKRKSPLKQLQADSVFLLAEQFIKGDSLERGEEILNQLWQSKFKSNISLCNKLGLVNLKQEEYQEAEDWFRKSLEISTDYFPGWLNLGISHAKQGELEEGISAYKKAGELERNNPKPFLNRGILYVRTKNWDEAISTLSISNDLSSGIILAKSKTYEAIAKFNAGEGHEVTVILKEATYFQPDYLFPRFYDVLTAESQLERKIQLDKILSLNVNLAIAHYLAAVQYDLINDKAKSLIHLEKAKNLDARFKSWTGTFQEIHIQNDFTKSVEAFTKKYELQGEGLINFDKEVNP